jgi:antitoxin Phd
MQTWQLQTAKARLSEVVRKALLKKPQEITLRGKDAVVVLSKETYDALVKPKPSFTQFMQQSPLVGMNLELNRDHSLTRQIDL